MTAALFTIYLDDRKVVRKFGTKPWLGKPFATKRVKVTVGVRWSLPKLDYEPDDNVLVAPVICLHPTKRKGMWQVEVDQQYKQSAEVYLLDNCQ